MPERWIPPHPSNPPRATDWPLPESLKTHKCDPLFNHADNLCRALALLLDSQTEWGTKRPESVEDGHSYHSVSHRVSFCITINPTSVMATILATWCPGRPAGQRLLSSLISSRSFAASLSAFISRVGWEGTTWEMMTCISHARNPSRPSLSLLLLSRRESLFLPVAVNARVLALASYTLRPTLCRVAIMDISNMLRLCNTRPRVRRAASRIKRLSDSNESYLCRPLCHSDSVSFVSNFY